MVRSPVVKCFCSSKDQNSKHCIVSAIRPFLFRSWHSRNSPARNRDLIVLGAVSVCRAISSNFISSKNRIINTVRCFSGNSFRWFKSKWDCSCWWSCPSGHGDSSVRCDEAWLEVRNFNFCCCCKFSPIRVAIR